MARQEQKSVSDIDKINRLKHKEYRDAYLESQVRTWIAYQVRALRKKLGLTQREMADFTGKNQSVIARLEDENYRSVSLTTLLDIAKSLDVAVTVQFVSYPEFLNRMRDKSKKAMQPPAIDESRRNDGTGR